MTAPDKIIILASGQNTRWPEGRKELAYIGNEPCVKRLVYQVREYVNEVTLITHVPAIAAFFPPDAINKGVNIINLSREHRRWKAETLYHLMAAYPEHLIILLADTIYSRATMDAIMDDHEAITFYGDTGEIYAVVVPAKANLFFWGKVREALVYAQENPLRYDVGHLWNIYRAVTGRDQVKHTDPPEGCPHFRYVEDWTRDIDSPADYALFLQEVVEKGLLDK